MNPDVSPNGLSASQRTYLASVLGIFDRIERQAAAQSLHTIPDPMTARERAEREAASGECG